MELSETLGGAEDDERALITASDLGRRKMPRRLPANAPPSTVEAYERLADAVAKVDEATVTMEKSKARVVESLQKIIGMLTEGRTS